MLNVTQHAAQINLSRKFCFFFFSFIRHAARNLLCAINICIRPLFDTNSHTHTTYCLAQCRLCCCFFFILLVCVKVFFFSRYMLQSNIQNCNTESRVVTGVLNLCFVFYYLCHSVNIQPNRKFCCFFSLQSFKIQKRFFTRILANFIRNSHCFQCLWTKKKINKLTSLQTVLSVNSVTYKTNNNNGNDDDDNNIHRAYSITQMRLGHLK